LPGFAVCAPKLRYPSVRADAMEADAPSDADGAVLVADALLDCLPPAFWLFPPGFCCMTEFASAFSCVRMKYAKFCPLR